MKSAQRSAKAAWAKSIGRAITKLGRGVAIKVLPRLSLATSNVLQDLSEKLDYWRR